MKQKYKRHIENYLLSLLSEIPAVAIEGLKGVGKSVSATCLSQTVFELDLQRDRTLIENDMNILAGEPPPVFIDEWQRVPEVWNYVRRHVDKNGKPGSFILAGSAKNDNPDIHSGAGRILRVKMYPLSLEERAIGAAAVSVRELLDQEKSFSALINGVTDIGFTGYMNEITASGFPAIRNYSPLRRSQMFSAYLDYLLSHDFAQQGIKIRQPRTLLRWLRAYAAASASDAGYGEILDAATAGEGDKPALKTTAAYRDALEKFWLIDELPPWQYGEDFFSRLKTTPKHYIADPALAAHLLNIDYDALTGSSSRRPGVHTVFDGKKGAITGRLFESLIQLSLRTYCAVNDSELSYLKTRNGDHEVDFIISRGNKTIAIEVKLSPEVKDSDVKHLLWLKGTVKERLTDALVIYTGPVAYRRKDGIAVVPAALLGA